jgi:hypothetical protein
MKYKTYLLMCIFGILILEQSFAFPTAWEYLSLNDNVSVGTTLKGRYGNFNLSMRTGVTNVTGVYFNGKKSINGIKNPLQSNKFWSSLENMTYVFFSNMSVYNSNKQLLGRGNNGGWTTYEWVAYTGTDGKDVMMDVSTGSTQACAFGLQDIFTDFKFHMIAIQSRRNGTGKFMRVIGDANDSRSTGWVACANFYNTNVNISYGSYASGTYSDGPSIYWDEMIVYRGQVLDTRQLLNIKTNYSVGCPVPFSCGAGVPAVSSSLSVFNQNLTSKLKKSTFLEGEDFRSYSNFTLSNNTVVLGASCNVSVPNGFLEFNSVQKNFTVCLIGCSQSSYFEKVSSLPVSNAVYDLLHFSVCRPSTDIVSLSVVLCGDSFSVSGGSIPSCASGNASIVLNSSKCKTKSQANFTISNSALFIGRHLVSGLSLDRQFSFFVDRMVYNSSSKVYVSNHSWEYYAHGLYTLTHYCSKGSFSNSLNNAVTVVNVPPSVFLVYVRTNFGIFNFSVGVLPLQFSSGFWHFVASVLDDDLDSVVYMIRNGSQQVFRTVYRTTPLGILNLSYTYFLKQGTYNFSVFANDTNKNKTFRSALFSVVDTTRPYCSGFFNGSVLNNTYRNWNISCSDDYFWLFNNTCDNGYRYFKDSIANQTFRFVNRTRVKDVDLTCKFLYCDGHTASDIGNMAVGVDLSKDSIISDSVVLVSNTDLKDISLIREKDKVSFCVVPVDSKVSTLSFKIPEGCVPAKNSKFAGHLVCEKDRVWIDFVNSEVSAVVVGSDIVLDLANVKDRSNLCFSSIGRLNCVNQTEVSRVSFPAEPGNQFGSSLEAWSFFFVLIIWLAFLLMSLLITGGTGRHMGILGMAQLFMGILLAVFTVPVFSMFFASIILFVAIGCFVAVLSG